LFLASNTNSLSWRDSKRDISDSPFVESVKDIIRSIGNFIALDIPAAL